MKGNDHRWTDSEMKELMGMWLGGKELDEICSHFDTTSYAINKIIGRMRKEGIPLPRRIKGHRAGRRNQLWTQSEVEYLIRRRKEKATAEDIALELDRSFLAVQGMIQRLRKEEVKVERLGQGSRKLWNPEMLRATEVSRTLKVVKS